MNPGTVLAADNEAQLAGVLAHESSHVALRHAASQASKANLTELSAALAAALIGSGSVAAEIGQVGLNLGVSSVLLKCSREAKSQADALGAVEETYLQRLGHTATHARDCTGWCQIEARLGGIEKALP